MELEIGVNNVAVRDQSVEVLVHIHPYPHHINRMRCVQIVVNSIFKLHHHSISSNTVCYVVAIM